MRPSSQLMVRTRFRIRGVREGFQNVAPLIEFNSDLQTTVYTGQTIVPIGDVYTPSQMIWSSKSNTLTRCISYGELVRCMFGLRRLMFM